MKLSNKPKILDYLILLCAIGLIIFLSKSLTGGSGATYLDIQNNGIDYLYPLATERVITLDGKIGPSTIEIKDGKAAFIESSCANKICIKMGWISKPGQFAACLPNGILITIKGNNTSEVDDVAE